MTTPVIVKPPRLRPGDLIGLVSPASAPSSSEVIEKGVHYLERLGYKVKVGRHATKVHGYLAGTDDQRADDLNEMIRDPSVKAIIAVRGGYGSARILSLIDFKALKSQPKIIVGYSDITALQLAIWSRAKLVTFSGPMAGVEMWDNIDPYTEEHFWRIVTSNAKVGLLSNPSEDPLTILRKGKATGRILGGNLAVLTALFGTNYVPNYKDVILVLEDVDEAPHRIDRMLTQLEQSKVLSKIAGLVFGKFIDCVPTDASKPHLTIGQVLTAVAQRVRVPVLGNFQYGHLPKKLTLPMGVRARLDAENGSFEVLEAAVR